MYKITSFIAILFMSINLFSQIEELNIIGQTRFSSSSHVNYDSIGQKLIVGAGSILQVYDVSDANNIHMIAQRSLRGFINETELYGDTLFVAATHDGVFALDYSSENLNVIDVYDMHDQGVIAAYDMCLYEDTLYIADNNKVRRLYYHNGTFSDLGYFGPSNSIAVDRKGDFVVVGNRGFPGTISIYNAFDLSNPLATWSNIKIWFLMDIQFADLRDDIIYVCGGPENLLVISSVFYALHYDGSTLSMADSLLVDGGLPGFAQVNIINMASKNDTLFLATTAASNFPTSIFTYMPVLDATGLPGDTMAEIAYINTGLWHFDAAVMKGTPYMAIASEWLGTIISDISNLEPLDTLLFLPSGGWCTNNMTIGDTLWACHQGDGLYAYSIDSLMFDKGFMNEVVLTRIENGGFVSDISFLNDSLILLCTGDIFNLNPWKQGGNPAFYADINKNWVSLEFIQTNVGDRIVGGFDNLLGLREMQLVDPFDSLGAYPFLVKDTVTSSLNSLAASGDTIYYGEKYATDFYLQVSKVIDDQFQLIDTILMPSEVLSVSVEGNQIAVACHSTILWLSWSGSTLQEDASFYDVFMNAQDIELKNNYIYIADKFFGAKVFDISQGVVAAEAIGSEGWLNLYGSTAITVSDDGMIFLSDFQGGVFIIEAFDSTLMIGIEPGSVSDDKLVSVFPNPANEYLQIVPNFYSNETMQFSLFDFNGRLIIKMKKPDTEAFVVNTSNLQSGIYFYSLEIMDEKNFSGKVIIQH